MDLRRAAGWLFVVLGAIGIVLSLVFVVTTTRGLGVLLGLLALPLVAALPLALLVVGWGMTHPRAEARSPTPRVVTPVPPVPESDAAALKLPIEACPDCGYLGIRMPAIHDGLWPGGGETGARMVCPRCDWQGLPASFPTTESYAEFTRDLNTRGGEGASA